MVCLLLFDLPLLNPNIRLLVFTLNLEQLLSGAPLG